MHVCTTLSEPTTEGVQTCLEWVEYSHPLAITKSQMVQIGEPILAILAICIGYAIIAKASKLL